MTFPQLAELYNPAPALAGDDKRRPLPLNKTQHSRVLA